MSIETTGKAIGVFGSSKPAQGSAPWQLAYDMGRALALGGYRVVNGGYQGTMGASARGARDAGGRTVGVTCTVWKGPANPWIDEEIRTENLSQRLDTLIEQSEGFIVLPGSTGTLLELACCWELINKKLLRPAPLICLGNYWRPVVQTVVNSGETDGKCVIFADKVDEAVQALDDYFKK